MGGVRGMSEHTPGTGSFEEVAPGLVCERFDDKSVSFDIFDATTWAGGNEQGLKYARLLVSLKASRDDLLEALEKLTDVFEVSPGELAQAVYGKVSIDYLPEWTKARAAILKAKGDGA